MLTGCWPKTKQNRISVHEHSKNWKLPLGCRTRSGDDDWRAAPTLLPAPPSRSHGVVTSISLEEGFNKTSIQPYQNIFVFSHRCLWPTATSTAVGLFPPTGGELFGPSPGVWDAWLTAIRTHWRNCFLNYVFFSFFFISHQQEQVYSDAGCTNQADQQSALTLMCRLQCFIFAFPRLLSTCAALCLSRYVNLSLDKAWS